ncbi:hypothetical protein [Dongia deserti]|uniref:hypothetical protein n=1 Tax=Dongia deserti TaxID=2268030 RepID=UPI0013C42594|nr:hypothetical protein [Dongia deserti]
MRSAPAILPDRHTIIGTQDVKRDSTYGPQGTGRGGVVFSGPNMNKLAPVTGLQAISHTPTRLADGRTVLLQSMTKPEMVVLDGRNVVKNLSLFDRSYTSVSASRTHIFVWTASAFQTFDPATLSEVSRVLWTGGGVSQPAIGPKGHVYAIAGNTLHVFPPPTRQLPPDRVTPQPGMTVVSTDSGTTTQDSKPYKPPLTMSGNRLFACEKLNGDDCGKLDYQTIADAFCEKEGFHGAGHVKVDSKNVKAETLDGKFCSKKKCKVFEQIICANN